MLSGNFRSRVFRRLVRRAFGPGRSLTPHVLRHTWASLHLARGTNLKWVQEAGGWASAKMLLDVYGHFMPTETRGFADAITTPNGPQTAPLALPDTVERRLPSRNIVYQQRENWSRRADSNRRPADYESAARCGHGLRQAHFVIGLAASPGRGTFRQPLSLRTRRIAAERWPRNQPPSASRVKRDGAAQGRVAESGERLSCQLLHDHPDHALVDNQQRGVGTGRLPVGAPDPGRHASTETPPGTRPPGRRTRRHRKLPVLVQDRVAGSESPPW